MKTTMFLMIIICITLIVSCQKENFIVTEPLYSLSVDMPDSVALGHQFNFIIHGMLPVPCDKYSRLDQIIRDRDVDVTAYYDRDTRTVCITEAVSIDVSGHFTPPHRGIFTFHYWRDNGETLNRNLIVY